MSSFLVAMVRFSPNGRSYPVNCDYDAQPGDRVIVRLEKQGRRLQAAEVVDTGGSKKPCANSIVCMESDAEAYGRGPDGVETMADLKRFLEQQGWKHYETTADDDRNGTNLSKTWPSVFVTPGYEYGDQTVGVRRRIHFGAWSGVFGLRKVSTPIGLSSRRDGLENRDKIVGGKICLQWPGLRISTLTAKEGENVYHKAAVWVEGPLTNDADPPDNSLREIRDAISDGSGGPYYLGDDVWL